MAKVIFNPNTIAKSADVNNNFAGTWDGTYMDDDSIHKRHLADDALPTIRKYSVASTSTLVINAELYEMFDVTALATGLTIGNPTGTFEDGRAALIRVKDNGTARSVGFGSQYRAVGVTLPTATVANKMLYILVRWNLAATKWDVLSIGREA